MAYSGRRFSFRAPVASLAGGRGLQAPWRFAPTVLDGTEGTLMGRVVSVCLGLDERMASRAWHDCCTIL